MQRALSKKAATYSPALRCSTIGVPGLNFSVRDGKRWNPGAKATKIFRFYVHLLFVFVSSVSSDVTKGTEGKNFIAYSLRQSFIAIVYTCCK